MHIHHVQHVGMEYVWLRDMANYREFHICIFYTLPPRIVKMEIKTDLCISKIIRHNLHADFDHLRR